MYIVQLLANNKSCQILDKNLPVKRAQQRRRLEVHIVVRRVHDAPEGYQTKYRINITTNFIYPSPHQVISNVLPKCPKLLAQPTDTKTHSRVDAASLCWAYVMFGRLQSTLLKLP
jgi:hypothetical protein